MDSKPAIEWQVARWMKVKLNRLVNLVESFQNGLDSSWWSRYQQENSQIHIAHHGSGWVHRAFLCCDHWSYCSCFRGDVNVNHKLDASFSASVIPIKNPFARCQDGYSPAPLGAPWKLLSAIKSSKFKEMPNTIFLPNESTLLGQSLDLKSHGLLLRKHPATLHPSNKLRGNILQKPFLRSFGSALACCTMSMSGAGPPKTGQKVTRNDEIEICR